MTLGYTHLATAGLSAMLTTLLITSYALEHPNRAMADAPALSPDRCCCQPTITEQTNDAIVRTLLSP